MGAANEPVRLGLGHAYFSWGPTRGTTTESKSLEGARLIDRAVLLLLLPRVIIYSIINEPHVVDLVANKFVTHRENDMARQNECEPCSYG